MDEGGEPACWLDRVCEDCGRVRERPGPGPCEYCAAGTDDTDGTSRASMTSGTDGTKGQGNENPRADHLR
ncbi:hypothetical protein SAMN05216371_7333 [Streptomyces sp. TLI_053]|uniref:hypothetical protein n=1 Tax=Streptomyces sp. TLI_053 TaxID=1855352 RepID=UPI00087CE37E|nr:hypothetical protein [Streptomyces sp. TLI_053]SDT82544.1 hypothetical protein SAMN05216371_7333 [Streptomyces sp. TLI_053]